MKALSLTQPWATLIALGDKRLNSPASHIKQIETRSWRTAHRGPLAIHAAKGFPKWAEETCRTEPFRSVLYNRFAPSRPGGPIIYLRDCTLPAGQVIAIADLIDCVRVEDVYFDEDPFCVDCQVTMHGITAPVCEKPFGDYSPGRWAWLLDNVRMLDVPICAKGALSLWEWNEFPELEQ